LKRTLPNHSAEKKINISNYKTMVPSTNEKKWESKNLPALGYLTTGYAVYKEGRPVPGVLSVLMSSGRKKSGGTQVKTPQVCMKWNWIGKKN
jgi:hypothetical protein